jgi:hypothetical protein
MNLRSYVAKFKEYLNQGAQADTSLVEFTGGLPVVHKVYHSHWANMGVNDAAAYEIAQMLDIDNVPMTVSHDDNESFQRFANNSVLVTQYGRLRSDYHIGQLETLTYFDVLIGNADRNGGNLMVHRDTGKLIFIDNSYTLKDSPLSPGLGGWSYESAAQRVAGHATWHTAAGVSMKFTYKKWSKFAEKARSPVIKMAVYQRYGVDEGDRIYTDMMGRLQAFEDNYIDIP